MDRRDFLGLLTRAFLWLSGAAGLVGLVRFLSYDPEPTIIGRYTLEPPAAYPPDSITPISEARAILVRDQVGFFARSLVCPHLGCVVERQGDGFRCPCHGSRFDSRGELENGPATRSMSGLWIELDFEGRLVLDISKEVTPEWRLVI